MLAYNHKAVESKWQKRWEDGGVFRAPEKPKADKKRYVLDMFPYPSGAGLHVGHPEGYTATDIYSRYLRMKGFSVLHPMGWDAFGLPAENYAIKSGIHPKESTETNIKTFTRQIKSLGFSYDWSREVNTSSPDYYKWTQWLFLQLYNAGLAYKKQAPVNWCPSCQTVLANEQVIDGNCERCNNKVIQKNLEQWFFKITGESNKEKGKRNKGSDGSSYPERLLSNLDSLDWPEPIKTMQRNWIGRSAGASIIFPLVEIPGQEDGKHSVEVFTTRPDTIFGATFMAISPELAEQWVSVGWKAGEDVKQYITKALVERAKHARDIEAEKTGIFAGIYAVNPANREKIPVWVTNYVLAGYGTGAIMAVPGHDERDWEFAKKFNLPIKQVIAPYYTDPDGRDAVRKNEPTVKRRVAYVLVKRQKEDKYLCLDWEKFGWRSGIIGGIEEGESLIEAATREIQEETGYADMRFVRHVGGEVHNHFYAAHKNENRYAVGHGLLFELTSDKRVAVEPEHTKNHKAVWIEGQRMAEWLNLPQFKYMWSVLTTGHECFAGDGIMINSGTFDGMKSEEAKWKITDAVKGKRTVQYKLRDWLISRQRYWGAPIPIIYCRKCSEISNNQFPITKIEGEQYAMIPVPEDDLPVTLPDDVDFRPKGESPLARSKSFHNVKCPKCGGSAHRESDTMDTFVDSSWYFLRYTDPNNQKAFADKKKIKAWLPVDTYVGGAEHAVLHLLYSRFVIMALHDLGRLDFEEPFLKLRNQGLILGPDGQKMSKSRGNVINPDDVVNGLGADCLRMYEMFIGPLEDAKPWDTNGIIGVRRFLERVWNAREFVAAEYLNDEQELAVGRELAKTVQKAERDIQSFGFNTAVAQFMIFINAVYKHERISTHDWETFLKVLSPFAPHITNELWEMLGHKEVIEKEKWPEVDILLLAQDEVTYAVQVNGKLRGNIVIRADADEGEVAEAAKREENVAKHVEGKTIAKTVFVKGKLINFVVK